MNKLKGKKLFFLKINKAVVGICGSVKKKANVGFLCMPLYILFIILDYTILIISPKLLMGLSVQFWPILLKKMMNTSHNMRGNNLLGRGLWSRSAFF